MSARIDVNAIRAVMWKDLTAVSRSKAVVLPMLLVPLLLLVMLPFAVGLAARARHGSERRRVPRAPARATSPRRSGSCPSASSSSSS